MTEKGDGIESGQRCGLLVEHRDDRWIGIALDVNHALAPVGRGFIPDAGYFRAPGLRAMQLNVKRITATSHRRPTPLEFTIRKVHFLILPSGICFLPFFAA